MLFLLLLFLTFFVYVLKQVPIYFGLGESCSAVKRQKCLVNYEALTEFQFSCELFLY